MVRVPVDLGLWAWLHTCSTGEGACLGTAGIQRSMVHLSTLLAARLKQSLSLTNDKLR